VDSAFVIGVIDKVVHIRGYTTDVRAGEVLDIRAAEQGTHPIRLHGHTVAKVEYSGSFVGSIRAERPWLVGGELTVEVSVINPPGSIPSTSLLATEHIRINKVA
jgi:hypothetical protein